AETNLAQPPIQLELGRRLSEIRFSADQPTPGLLEDSGFTRKAHVAWTDFSTIQASADPEFVHLRSMLAQRAADKRAFYLLDSPEGKPPKLVFAAPLKG